MQKIVAALALSGAAAFVAPVAPAAGTALNGKEEMQALAESNPDLLGRTIGALPSPTDHGVDAVFLKPGREQVFQRVDGQEIYQILSV